MKACEIDLDLVKAVPKKYRAEDIQVIYQTIEAGVKMKGYLYGHLQVTDEWEDD
jgi:hypothetical protein